MSIDRQTFALLLRNSSKNKRVVRKKIANFVTDCTYFDIDFRTNQSIN